MTWLGTDAYGLDRPPDLRLFLPAVAAWSAALGALAAPPWLAWLCAGVLGCAALVVFAVIRLPWEAPALTLVATLVCGATVAAVAGAHVHRTASSAAASAVERELLPLRPVQDAAADGTGLSSAHAARARMGRGRIRTMPNS